MAPHASIVLFFLAVAVAAIFDFGEDLWCINDLTEEGRTVTGIDVLWQALLRRWTTVRGRLIDDDDYGTDLREFINEDVDALTLVRIRSEACAEAEKDERVTKCVPIPGGTSFDPTTGIITLALAVTVGETAFRLTLAVSSVTVELLKVSE
jgi:hypothetical protein